jgi:hypothetical protein
MKAEAPSVTVKVERSGGGQARRAGAEMSLEGSRNGEGQGGGRGERGGLALGGPSLYGDDDENFGSPSPPTPLSERDEHSSSPSLHSLSSSPSLPSFAPSPTTQSPAAAVVVTEETARPRLAGGEGSPLLPSPADAERHGHNAHRRRSASPYRVDAGVGDFDGESGEDGMSLPSTPRSVVSTGSGGSSGDAQSPAHKRLKLQSLAAFFDGSSSHG